MNLKVEVAPGTEEAAEALQGSLDVLGGKLLRPCTPNGFGFAL